MRSQSFVFFLFLMTAFAGCNDDQVVPDQHVIISGKKYPTVKIGDLTWTAANYDGPGGVKINDNTKPEYGKYYSKQEVDGIELPEGWRIPTMDDYKALAQAYEITIPSNSTNWNPIKTLISVTHWNNAEGTNASGFNAYPTGYVYGNAEPLDGDIAEFWTAEGNTLSIQEAGADSKSLRITFYDSTTSPDLRFTIRFVKD